MYKDCSAARDLFVREIGGRFRKNGVVTENAMSKQITLAKTLKIASARKKDVSSRTNDKNPNTTGTNTCGGEVVIDLDEEDITDEGAFLDGLSHEEAMKLEELPEVLDDFFDDEDDEFENDIASDSKREAQPSTAPPSAPSTILSSSMIQPEVLQGFDEEMGQSWVYPINYPLRDYQFNIVHKSLFKNTLVSLPTGLGKTFIAAVVMYNFYRWYPRGKVVFLAPTKPLVAQQIEACYKIVGIKQEMMAEMTGGLCSRANSLGSLLKVVSLVFTISGAVSTSSSVCIPTPLPCVLLGGKPSVCYLPQPSVCSLPPP